MHKKNPESHIHLGKGVYDTMVMHNYDGLAKEIALIFEEMESQTSIPTSSIR